MKEQLIEFETAKLAKEKGFDESVRDYYHPSYGICNNHIDNYNSCRWAKGYYSAPTQSLLQSYLGKKHGLYAYIDWANLQAVIVDYKNHEGKELLRIDTNDFLIDAESEEEYLEKLLFDCLSFIT